jgi:hypothetical protein
MMTNCFEGDVLGGFETLSTQIFCSLLIVDNVIADDEDLLNHLLNDPDLEGF